jgi:NADPH:quinone reductase-like Zn-dependent oxidoreductase
MRGPEVGDSDVLIDAHAAGLNLLDSKIKSGESSCFYPTGFRSCWVMTSPGS